MLKAALLLVCFVVTIRGCLITNCPRGGKRSGSFATLEAIARECSSCGPNHLGQCFGPHICCGPRIGCFIGTPETYKCHKESLLTRPCIAGFAMCRGNTARCAADGICCSQESCYVDSACRLSETVNNDSRKIDAEISDVALPENNEAVSNEVRHSVSDSQYV